MRDREIEHIIAKYPDLDEKVTRWRAEHPAGTLQQAVRELELWHNPHDQDAQRLVWYALRHTGDPVAARLGFQAMRRTGIPAARDAAPRDSSPREGAATGCAAGTPAGGTT